MANYVCYIISGGMLHLKVLKNLDLSFYVLRTGIKRSHSLLSQDYTADDSSNRCFECSKM